MLEYNPYAPDVQHNPYPTWKRLRDEAPVYHNEEFGFYALSRYDDVLAAFLDPQTFISGNGVTIGPADRNQRLIAMDDPQHARVRKVLSRLFTPRQIADLEPFVRGLAARLLDEAIERGSLDVVQDFSLRLPLAVIGELLGIPPDLRERVHELSNISSSRGTDPEAGIAAARAAIVEMNDLYRGLVVERRKQPGDDPISALITAEVVDDDGSVIHLDDDLIAEQFNLLGAAGHETVMNLIGNGTVALWWYPDQRAELVADPGLIPGAVEEMLRWDNPAPIEGRWSTRDVELHGVTIPADQRVVLLQGAANHDERRYPDPELFDIHRRIERPLGFGFGIHLCIGASLARLELRVAFEEILKRFPDYEIDEAGVGRRPISFFRGLEHIPLVAA